ncbi:MAG: sulfur carrier protein ThiS [Verrucomicrobiales bacterium]|nr:sulfur carrier protein ThiS [Verrucomicrobiae bacterium]
MKIRLNGKNHDTTGQTANIQDLLVELKLDGQPVLVEHNGNALFPRDFATTLLQENDQVELIRVVAGG